MGLFGKKKDIRFETITVEREKSIFKGLEKKGWTMIQDTFQFDMDKPPEKLRKMALKMARDLKGELLVEVWDPIHERHPYRGLTYSAWRKMTPDELMRKKIEERKKKKVRPDYSSSMGDASEMLRREKEERFSEDDLKAIDEIVESEHIHSSDMEVVGEASKLESDESSSIKAISSFDPMDHQGEVTEDDLDAVDTSAKEPKYESAPDYGKGESGSGPVFQSSIKLETVEDMGDRPETREDFDAMEMMKEAGTENETGKDSGSSDLPPPPPPPRKSSEGDDEDEEDR